MTERGAKILAELKRILREQVTRGTTYEGYLLIVADAVRLNPELAEAISPQGRVIIDSMLKATGRPALFDGDAVQRFADHAKSLFAQFDEPRPTPEEVVADLLAQMFPVKEG